MASPQLIIFAIYDSSGNPKTGVTPTFSVYKNEIGTNLSQPGFTEIGGGLYSFQPIFATGHLVCYIISTGAGNTPPHLSGWLRTEDFNPIFTGTSNALVFLSAVSVDETHVDVTFSAQPPDIAIALDPTQYTITPSLSVTGVIQLAPTVFRLTTSNQTNGTSYTINWPSH